MMFISSLLLLYTLLPITTLAFPLDLEHKQLPDARDIGQQPICVPIPTLFSRQEDVVAKIRPSDGICQTDEYLAFSGITPNPMLGSSLAARQAEDPYACGENKPCSNGACCGKGGFCGYGPKYCGTTGTSPNDDCWSNCDAHAECGRYSDPPKKTCPLNVCCSQHGFCGTTQEFCEKTDDDETSCQSNCDQPGSGASGGNVQKRVIGYYEAWNYKKKCIGMSMQDIPVGSLTHIFYSFGYIRPDTYDIIPIQDGGDQTLSEDTLKEFASLKRRNPAVKVTIALGGWTFNDNGTIWQPVFSDLSSSKEKRSRFIDQLTKFMKRFGFDGVDLDWEYPGASDRGGHKNDGENFTKLLEEMRDAFSGKYEVSFTAPTSYWYLRHFDIKGSSEAADFVNLMAYDLHGIWDANNPIGAQVLAHTNLTEIENALNLLWRNEVKAGKVNLGLGFYGRSFQLSDPSCYQPGCSFKGGAAPGPCTDNSGTLSYAEIMDIIDEHNLTPYYDEEHAVKWITWGGDQWVSFDDFDTIQQKISFANGVGLGGLLIWAIDLDTRQLDALEAVIYPEKLGNIAADESMANTWEQAGEGHCRVTDCGTTGCKTGEIPVKTTQCSDENFWTGEYKVHTLCCPFASAPDPDKCHYRGGYPWCNGQCHPGEVALQSSLYGDYGKCLDGRKFYCCEAEGQVPDCRWTDCDGSCDADTENELTWKYGGCSKKKKKKFCCSKEESWKNCAWHGKPGNCFDNHCETGWQVALSTDYEGEGENCGSKDRKRTFCCDPPDGKSPFLPVPLDYLFKNPPPEEEADTDFSLKVDPTYGGTNNIPFTEDPKNAPFGFVVLTSPDELQVSLDKRDGSHWEVFDCFDAITEGEHTVRMMCTDLSETSNCNKIHLGHGAPGTIVEMPEGCGPGKYAVVKEMKPSVNTKLPDHLVKRGVEVVNTIYDLTFDYDFRRVPRDLGNTQMRIDFSNEQKYWERVVDKAASHKKSRKRSLEEFGGSHRRWLEEEWRDDVHFGGLSQEELHKRWFGSDIVDWLKGLINGVQGGLDVSHTYSEDFILKIIDQRLSCPNFAAKLDVRAETHIDIDVNYGFTLIATLGSPIDLSNSYLYFRTKGEANAKFIIDAAVTAFFDTGDVLMFSADKFGAAFSVPGIVTIGPNFKLFGRLEGQATLGVNFESRVKLAEWDVRQTYPVANDEWDPEASKSPKKDGTQSVLDPKFDYGLSLDGHLTAHIKPTITFGIDFNEDFIKLDSCAVNLVADGHVTFHAELKVGSESSFCYGVDAGADLYATLDAPDAFKWALPQSPFPITRVDDVQIYPTKNEQSCIDLFTKRDAKLQFLDSNATIPISARSGPDLALIEDGSSPHNVIDKRAKSYGPLVSRIDGLACPGEIDVGEIPSCPLCEDEDEAGLTKRAEACWFDPEAKGERCEATLSNKRDSENEFLFLGNKTLSIAESEGEAHWLEKRTIKEVSWPYHGGPPIGLPCGTYKRCGLAHKQPGVNKWFGFRGSDKTCGLTIEKLDIDETDPSKYVTEHIYEVQLLGIFWMWLIHGTMPAGYTNAGEDWVNDIVIGGLGGQRSALRHSQWTENSLFFEMTHGLGGDHNPGGLALTWAGINGRKEVFFHGNMPASTNDDTNLKTRQKHRHTAAVFSYMRSSWIWPKFVASSQFMEQRLHEFDELYTWGSEADEPGRPQRATGQPAAGLRDLYCYWIDDHLGSIEAEAERWWNAARPQFEARYGMDDDGIKWLRNVFVKGGPISIDKMKFLRTTRQHARPNPGNPKIWATSNYQDLWVAGTGTDFGAAGPF
ncbi:glycosyl hydrolases family 18-domain-containing protein [Xylaria bambusicola]|uniref:glycosyl hydrolases family 18-domain-containing protein n=1 Tax=Xylaria bambusicola TaxID=326684 RepID=UPI002008CA91|nr:glycosyl hydrolases family 18-domain-containing protein [Xylaria bambusicola]KAI0523939.1 glycosyl hydrolases family 18-domain-containing protein [Xylaria bambusicola]